MGELTELEPSSAATSAHSAELAAELTEIAKHRSGEGKEVVRQARGAAENLARVDATVTDLWQRIQALPPDALTDDPNNVIHTNAYGAHGVSRGRFIMIERQVGRPDGSRSTHTYEAQIRSKVADPAKPWESGDPAEYNLVAAEDEALGVVPYRLVGTTENRQEPALRGRASDLQRKDTELNETDIQAGVDAILAELTGAVEEKEAQYPESQES